MAREHTVLFSADADAEKVGALAARTDRDHGDDGVVVVVVLNEVGFARVDVVSNGDEDEWPTHWFVAELPAAAPA